jgi:predicted CXXCH cytochrome family protein
VKKYVKFGLTTAAGLAALTGIVFYTDLWKAQKAESPHYRSGACMVCHISTENLSLKTDELILCTSCHDQEGEVKVLNAEGHEISVDLGRSHPWGLEPSFNSMPKTLPLNDHAQITCQTCHDVHLDNTTNHMVRLCEDGDFTPLCHDCHPNY